jgi:uncharacterized membrane protein YfcA
MSRLNSWRGDNDTITAIGGSYIGKKIVGKIDQNKFRKIVLVAIIIVSINFIISGSIGMSS